MQGQDDNYKKITDSRLLNAGRLLNLLRSADLDITEQIAISDAILQLLGQAYRSLLAEVMESYQVAAAGGLPESALSAQQQLHELHSSELNELAAQEKIAGSVPAQLLKSQTTLQIHSWQVNSGQINHSSVIATSVWETANGHEPESLLQWLRDYKAVLRERLVEW